MTPADPHSFIVDYLEMKLWSHDDVVRTLCGSLPGRNLNLCFINVKMKIASSKAKRAQLQLGVLGHLSLFEDKKHNFNLI